VGKGAVKVTYKKQPHDIMWLGSTNILHIDPDLGEFLQEHSVTFDPDKIITMAQFVDFWEHMLMWWKECQRGD
jgi:hypothetical protein